MASEQPVLPAPGSGATPSGPRAGFWIRLGAVLIDGVPLGIVSFGIGSTFGTGGNLLGPVIGLAYYTYFEGSASGQTVGKKLCDIRVIDFDGRGSIGHARAATRYLMSRGSHSCSATSGCSGTASGRPGTTRSRTASSYRLRQFPSRSGPADLA